MKKVLLYFLLFSSFRICAWWDIGHMIIAQIAYNMLNDQVRNQVDHLIKIFDTSDDIPGTNSFVSAAPWADIISKDIEPYFYDHSQSTIYDPENILTPPEKKIIKLKDKYTRLLEKLYAYQITLSDKKSHTWSKAYALRWFIHLVGDAHQPCHCTTFYSKKFPFGDWLGIRFKTTMPLEEHHTSQLCVECASFYQEHAKKYFSLHALWDSCGDQFKSTNRPVTKEDLDYVKQCATNITQQHPESSFGDKINNLDPHMWVTESHSYAKNTVYQNIKPNTMPSHEYLERCKKISILRLALAGYRLGHTLNGILKNN